MTGQNPQRSSDASTNNRPGRGRQDGSPVMSWLVIAAAIGIVVLGFGAWWTFGLDRGMQPGMDGEPMDDDMAGMGSDVPRFPPVAAYYDGQRVFFAHTETSDREVSQMLTGMMGSPVVTVPDLARTPENALGPVFVFMNGIKPDGPRGPLGFQPDVFDSAPGDPDYTPLRRLVQVTWADDAEPRLVTSSAEVERTVDAGELSLKRTGVVINAPLLTWPGGNR